MQYFRPMKQEEEMEGVMERGEVDKQEVKSDDIRLASLWRS